MIRVLLLGMPAALVQAGRFKINSVLVPDILIIVGTSVHHIVNGDTVSKIPDGEEPRIDFGARVFARFARKPEEIILSSRHVRLPRPGADGVSRDSR